jgi:subtilisin family serine protease
VAAALLGLPLAAAAPAQASASSQWPLQTLKAAQVWNITKGSGATVGIIDTGVASIPDTQGALQSGADFSNGTTTSSTGNGQDDLDGHGTSMAALIVGAGNVVDGLAPDAKLIPIRATTGQSMQADSLAAAIQYAISRHVSVISISLRAPVQNSTLAAAVQAAINANIVIVAASGDESLSTVDYPGAYPGVVAVGAVDQNGSIWSSSNTGPQVTLVAPGVSVPTEDNFGDAATTDGTSASTAYVSATVALIRAAHPSWTAGQVIRDLISTADPASGQSAGQHSDQYGYGIVDPLKALQAAAPTQTSNPLLGSAGGSTASAAPSAGATGNSASASPSSSSHTGLIIGIVVAVVVVILIIVLLVALSRRNRNNRGGGGPSGSGPGAGGPGGGGGYGWPQQPPHQGNPYQQQNPYHPQQQGQPQPPQQYRPQQQPQQYPYPPQQQQ